MADIVFKYTDLDPANYRDIVVPGELLVCENREQFSIFSARNDGTLVRLIGGFYRPYIKWYHINYLNDFEDIEIATLEIGYVLRFNGVQNYWEAGYLNLNLDSFSDVVINLNLTAYSVLSFSSNWINQQVSASPFDAYVYPNGGNFTTQQSDIFAYV